jgi:hypothetical protein
LVGTGDEDDGARRGHDCSLVSKRLCLEILVSDSGR